MAPAARIADLRENVRDQACSNCSIIEHVRQASYRAALGMLAFAGIARCQAHDCSSAAQRLRSAALNDKAWGAQLAAACGLSGLAGEIGTGLVALGPGGRFGGSETFWAARAMLDALIRLGTPLPSPLLASIAQAFPKEATILLLRDAPSHLELLAEIRKRRSGLESTAASNALSRLRAPGFAASILTGLALRHRFLVSDNGQRPGEGRGGSIGSGILTLRVPANFPAIGMYELDAENWLDGDMISDGPTPIYSHRTVWEPDVEKTFLSGGVGWCLPCQDIAYLAQMAEVRPGQVESAAYGSTGVRWRDRAQVSAEISRTIAEQESALEQLATALLATGALRNSEMGFTLHIRIEIEDGRGDRSEPLPLIDPKVEFQLH
jgi:hypothetical protein